MLYNGYRSIQAETDDDDAAAVAAHHHEYPPAHLLMKKEGDCGSVSLLPPLFLGSSAYDVAFAIAVVAKSDKNCYYNYYYYPKMAIVMMSVLTVVEVEMMRLLLHCCGALFVHVAVVAG